MNRNERIKETERINRQYESKYFPKVRRVIKDEISSLIEVVKHGGIDAGIRSAQIKIHSGGLPKIIQDLYNEVGLRYARKTWIELQKQKRASSGNKKEASVLQGVGVAIRSKADAKIEGSREGDEKRPPSHFETKGFGFVQAWVDFIKAFLYQFLIEKITFRVSETTREVLLNVLYKATEEGWGVDKTVKALEDLPLSETQAARIVRTEIGRAANTGAMAAGSTFEFEQTKEWIAAHDKRTRGQDVNDHADHFHLDGVTIDYDDLFTDPRNGAQLRMPHDPDAPAANTVNCRCTVAVVAKIGSDGRLIPKKRKVSI